MYNSASESCVSFFKIALTSPLVENIIVSKGQNVPKITSYQNAFPNNEFFEGASAEKSRKVSHSESCKTIFSKRAQVSTQKYATFFFLPYLSSIHKKAIYRCVLDGESALAWDLPFPGHLSSA